MVGRAAAGEEEKGETDGGACFEVIWRGKGKGRVEI